MVTRHLAIVMAATALCGTTSGAERPNFVWLLSEDNSKHYLRLFDDHGAPTLRIEKLAADGLVFERAFSNSPVCSVARTTLMTGCYAPCIGTQFHRAQKLVPLPDGLKMFPAYLRDAGYYTTNNQKKDYNAIEGDGVWDESSGRASWRSRAADQPFFHMQSFPATHESSLHFSREDMQEPTSTDPGSVFLAPYHPDTPTFRYTYARYHDQIQLMDAQIGQIVAELEADGLLDDTFIFYFGDHGGVLPGSKGYAYNRGLHVPLVMRVPANWRHLVDAEPGTRVKGFVSFVDFGPTLLHLAGIDVPPQVDGRPFLGKGISLAEVNQRDEAFGHADRFDEKCDLVRTLRKGDFEYVRSYQPFNFDGLQNNYRYNMLAYVEWREMYRAGKLHDVQRQFFEPRPAELLYDLANDPHETRNLASDPAHRKTLLEMRERLTQRIKAMPDLSFYPESHLVRHAFESPVKFGREHHADIGRLVDLANLQVVPYDEAQSQIEAALASDDPWQRYWGLVVCSSHEQTALAVVELAKKLAANDPERLVRVRAAEFLGLYASADPRETILEALRSAESSIEANLILNTVVLLRDRTPSFYRIDVSRDLFEFPKDERELVDRRLEYLSADDGQR